MATWSRRRSPRKPIVPPILNEMVNFGWEYVWHCHILSHEEMDMMRPIVLNVISNVPAAPSGAIVVQQQAQVRVSWADPTPVNYVTQAGFGNRSSEIGFKVERANGAGPFTAIGTALANAASFVDNTVAIGTTYRYRVAAFNQAGTSPFSAVSVPLTVAPPPPATAVTLTASLPSPQVLGTPVVFTAAGQGSYGYQYRFFIRNSTTAAFTMVQDYGGGSTWTLPTSMAADTYRIVVHVRTTTGVSLDAQAGIGYTLLDGSKSTTSTFG